jgi:hypothetical protein
MNSQSPDIALLVHSCDRYEFLYKGFEIFFNRYWDFEVPCRYYFATEEKETEIKEFQNVRSGRGQWSDRLALLLREKIQERYVLYFQEDMWLTKKINPVFFRRLFELAKEQDWKQVKLHSSEIYKTSKTKYNIEGFNIAQVDNRKSHFLMSHQVTLWEREFFLAQLFKGEHPWRNERKGTKRLKKLDPAIFHADYFAENGKPEINENDHPLGRSEYFTVSENGMLNNSVVPFIDLLRTGAGTEKEYAAQLEHHFTNRLTHDGRARPKKTDPFKRLKNWMTGN